MSIKDQIRIINRVKSFVEKLQKTYSQNNNAAIELKKLHQSLIKLETYLNEIDHLKPNYSTNTVKQFMDEINLHLDILKGEINKQDYQKLRNGVKVIRTLMKFHPIKYSFFTFILAWFYEMLYFI